MSILVVLWISTLAVIYGSSYISMTKENKELMQLHAEMVVFSGYSKEDGKTPPEMGRRKFDESSPRFRLENFYSVVVSNEDSNKGEVLGVLEKDMNSVYSDAELEKLAADVMNRSKEFGKVGNLSYYKEDRGYTTLVVFMDNTVMNDNVSTLFKYTLIYGAVALVIIFFISSALAKRIVKPLEESYEKQKQFISDAGHELKTPVSVVNANAELLAREIGENQWLDNIRYENERMGNLVTQLLDLARMENVETELSEVDFSRIVEGECLPFESIAFEKGVTLETDIESNINVLGDASKLKQLVSILVDNALRHSEGDKVFVSLKKDSGQALLSVKNKGAEIPPDQREKIFERFYRADSARTDTGNYGLGLAIAKSIAVAHKGNIEVLCNDGFVEFVVRI